MGLLLKHAHEHTVSISPFSGEIMQCFGKVGLKIDLVEEVNIDENF